MKAKQIENCWNYRYVFLLFPISFQFLVKVFFVVVWALLLFFPFLSQTFMSWRERSLKNFKTFELWDSRSRKIPSMWEKGSVSWGFQELDRQEQVTFLLIVTMFNTVPTRNLLSEQSLSKPIYVHTVMLFHSLASFVCPTMSLSFMLYNDVILWKYLI